MNDSYILTIGIPTYNRRKTLEKTLNSVLSQITNEVELIVSDNASTDDTKIYMNKVLENNIIYQMIQN